MEKLPGVVPTSALRNSFPKIEERVKNGELIILTKNGYDSMVLMNCDLYNQIVSELKDKEVGALTKAYSVISCLSSEEISDDHAEALDMIYDALKFVYKKEFHTK
jgi:PHD/YefM family antitoxin component YafN of YafNO toxin-antitoxin module